MGNEHSVVAGDETFGEEGKFKVHIKLYDGLAPLERLKLTEACKLWVKVWQSEQFKDWLMTFEFADEKSNQEICEKLLGDISKANVVAKQADIEIWGERQGVADITVLNTTFVAGGEHWEGTPYMATYPAAKLAGFLAYDYCRFHGFLHAGIAPTHTVPFAIAKETKRLAEQMAEPDDIAQSSTAKPFEKDFSAIIESKEGKENLPVVN